MSSLEVETTPRRRGRPADVDPDRVALLALRHFAEHGYDATTMDEIASLAGIGRRTLFRYFPSKPDLVWGGLEPVVGRMRAVLEGAPADESARDVLARAMTASLELDAEHIEATRLRLRLMASDPTLIGFGVTRLGANRDILAEFLARRLDVPADGLRAQVLADAISSANFSALLWWAARGTDDDPATAAVTALDELLRGLPD
ncbi:TetR family transcriptional regulator [Leifsonia shinshuensis]|uniref:TetR family transcriptional regulator n=1 Tax=Leifsonia shinshuensis TaxID=150026 RepID=UPI001F50EA1E|nr:TetR family transcriptional regulator [Leifsonia shinshuensis]MCI0158634.1 TetR family transcriptional regulator [Leifsonia shinshuensis]